MVSDWVQVGVGLSLGTWGALKIAGVLRDIWMPPPPPPDECPQPIRDACRQERIRIEEYVSYLELRIASLEHTLGQRR
jgi:hypothetical protein